MSVYPPIEPRPVEFIAYREEWCKDKLIVVMQNHDSYKLAWAEFERWCKLIHLPEHVAQMAMDRLNGFGAIHVDCENLHIEHLPRQAVKEALAAEQSTVTP